MDPGIFYVLCVVCVCVRECIFLSDVRGGSLLFLVMRGVSCLYDQGRGPA